jgi:hypothetical protein
MQQYDREGRLWFPPSKEGRIRLKRYLDEQPGQKIQNLWDDISPTNSQAQERLGYPTQKPEALLERIIQASSNEGDTVLDPFCGCGTAVAAAQNLNRQWIGIDITHLAITLIKHRRLKDTFGESAKYVVLGEPVSNQVGARPAEQKKVADKGIDGRLYFHDDKSGKTKQISLSVKAGGVAVSHLRDLRGVLDREGAAIGVLIRNGSSD